MQRLKRPSLSASRPKPPADTPGKCPRLYLADRELRRQLRQERRRAADLGKPLKGRALAHGDRSGPSPIHALRTREWRRPRPEQILPSLELCGRQIAVGLPP